MTGRTSSTSTALTQPLPGTLPKCTDDDVSLVPGNTLITTGFHKLKATATKAAGVIQSTTYALYRPISRLLVPQPVRDVISHTASAIGHTVQPLCDLVNPSSNKTTEMGNSLIDPQTASDEDETPSTSTALISTSATTFPWESQPVCDSSNDAIGQPVCDPSNDVMGLVPSENSQISKSTLIGGLVGGVYVANSTLPALTGSSLPLLGTVSTTIPTSTALVTTSTALVPASTALVGGTSLIGSALPLIGVGAATAAVGYGVYRAYNYFTKPKEEDTTKISLKEKEPKSSEPEDPKSNEPDPSIRVNFGRGINGGYIVKIGEKLYKIKVIQTDGTTQTDITGQVIENPNNNSMKEVTRKVCRLMEKNNYLKDSSSASVKLGLKNRQAEILDIQLGEKSIPESEIASLKVKEKFASNALNAKIDTSFNKPKTIAKLKPVVTGTLREINNTGNCLPASLLSQIKCAQNHHIDPSTQSPSNEEVYAMRQTVKDRLGNKEYRAGLVNKIQDQNNPMTDAIRIAINEILRSRNRDSQRFIRALNTTKDTYPSLKGFDKYLNDLDEDSRIKEIEDDYSGFDQELLEALLVVYSQFIDSNLQRYETYLDPFFLHLYVDITNSGRNENQKIKVIVFQFIHNIPENGFEIRSIIPNDTALSDTNFDNTYFVYHTGGAHYQSPIRNEEMMRSLIRNYQDSELADFFKRIGGYQDINAINEKAVIELLQAFKELKNTHPIAYEAMRDLILQGKNVEDPDNVAYARLYGALYAKLQQDGEVDGIPMFNDWGITQASIERIVNTKRVSTGSSAHIVKPTGTSSSSSSPKQRPVTTKKSKH